MRRTTYVTTVVKKKGTTVVWIVWNVWNASLRRDIGIAAFNTMQPLQHSVAQVVRIVRHLKAAVTVLHSTRCSTVLHVNSAAAAARTHEWVMSQVCHGRVMSRGCGDMTHLCPWHCCIYMMQHSVACNKNESRLMCVESCLVHVETWLVFARDSFACTKKQHM